MSRSPNQDFGNHETIHKRWPLGLGSAAVCWRLSQCSTIFPSSNRKISKPTMGPPMLYSVWVKTKFPLGKHERY